MNKLALFMTVAALAAGLKAGSVDDPILEFSSTGPDTYADGTAALPGECYALAYTAAGKTFSLTATGDKGEGVEYVLFAPVAKRDASGNAYCPTLVYQIDAAKFDTLSKGGTWGVYLLDTRVKAEDGSVTTAAFTAGKPATVNSAAAAAAATPAGVGAAEGGTAVASATTLGGGAAILAVIDNPAITAIKPEGGKVVITLDKMVDAADYKIVSGFTPGAIATEAKAVKAGNTFTVDADDGATFFKVLGTRKFGE